ncbi:hypothetical protein GGI1_08089 [Acidithiobacillus sp. GGI-221]|nr:hypothetical protein GGI1_08089 [Acidithiobacillus sp. GGI-221]
MADFLKEERVAAKFLFGLILLEFVAVMIMGSGIPLRGFQHLQSVMVTQELGASTQKAFTKLPERFFSMRSLIRICTRPASRRRRQPVMWRI